MIVLISFDSFMRLISPHLYSVSVSYSNAPHTMDDILNEKWDRKYSREVGAYPAPWIRANKFWPTCGRVDNVYGDRNLVCTCPPLSAYEDDDEEEEIKSVA